MNKNINRAGIVLRSLKRRRITVRIARAAILILFLLLWEVSADTGLIDSFIFSSRPRSACVSGKW